MAPSIADRLAAGLRDAVSPPGSEGRSATPPLLPRTVTQLSWLGVDRETLRRIAPFVVILPVRTPINLNTASREVIAASVDGMDLSAAGRLVQSRQRTPFKAISEAQALIPPSLALDASRVDVRSNFFEVRGRIRLGDRVLEELSLVERRGPNVVTLQRQRVNLRDAPQ